MALRPIAAMKMPDVEPQPVAGGVPVFLDVDPRTLLVDEAYQRNLSERSVSLIRRIAGAWDWRAFKPPVITDVSGRYHVLDGQHTAIAAASHPAIKTIPAMLVGKTSAPDRAIAFVRHNRDRLQATPTQLHIALVAAGDEDALTIDSICRRAHVRILKSQPGAANFKVGDTMAIATIRALLNRRHAAGARRVIEICSQGMMAPISAAAIKAVEEILFGEFYRGQADGADVSTTLREMGAAALEKEGARFAAEHDLPVWKGLTAVLFRNTKRSRRGRPAAA